MLVEKIISMYSSLIGHIKKTNDFPLLFIRLVLAYGFYITASMKWENIDGVAVWFDQLGIPLPVLSTYAASLAEGAGVVLLALGLATRIISIPLIITMIVAITTVHLKNGFVAGDNGFEIPLYYLIMLFVLLINGAGRISLDYILSKRFIGKSI